VDGIVTIDEHAIVLSFNRAAEKIFGYPAGEVIGRKVNMLMPSPHSEHHDSYMSNYMKTGVARIIGLGREVTGKRKDGAVFPLYLAVSEVWVGDERLFTGILRDITELKNAEDEIRRARDELEVRVKERTAELELVNERLQREIGVRRQAEEELKAYTLQLERSNRDLEDFAFVASHDLQEPLRKIRTFGDRISETNRECLDERGLDYMGRLERSARRLQDLILALLDYSRIATGAKPFDLVDMNALIGEIINDRDLPSEEATARFEVGDLPVIEADSHQLRRLFEVLISNALKFHREGEPSLVRVSCSACFRGVCTIIVEDNGIGFDEKYLDRIFKPFQRLHGKEGYEGTGMGLAMARKIVERHHGAITARSAPGKGSTFLVTLPVRQPAP
jgi:two-component system sensor kinase FixL